MADKCAVVTGASKGIGLEIAKGLLADGYRVFGFARSRAEVSDIDWIRCDVTDSQSVTDAFKQVIEQTCWLSTQVWAFPARRNLPVKRIIAGSLRSTYLGQSPVRRRRPIR